MILLHPTILIRHFQVLGKVLNERFRDASVSKRDLPASCVLLLFEHLVAVLWPLLVCYDIGVKLLKFLNHFRVHFVWENVGDFLLLFLLLWHYCFIEISHLLWVLCLNYRIVLNQMTGCLETFNFQKVISHIRYLTCIRWWYGILRLLFYFLIGMDLSNVHYLSLLN